MASLHIKSKVTYTNTEVSNTIKNGLDTLKTGSLQKTAEQVKPDSFKLQRLDTAVTVSKVRLKEDTVKQMLRPQDTVKKTSQEAVKYDIKDTRAQQESGETVTIISTDLLTTTTIDQSLLDTVALNMDTISLTNNNIAVDSLSICQADYSSNKEGIPLSEMLHRSDGIFCILLFCFFIVANIYSGGLNFIKENIMLAFSPQKANKLDLQSLPTKRETIGSYFLVFQAIMLISISIYEGLERYTNLTSPGDKSPFIHIGAFVILISVFILLKLIFNRIVGYIFDMGNKMALWNKTYLILISVLGLLCFLPTLLLVYSNWWHGAIIGFSLFLFIIIQGILIFRSIMFFMKHGYGVLSMIAYLLTVEVLPYMYLGVGLFYFYQIDIFNTI